MSFKIIKKSKRSSVRLGEIKTKHGIIKTPCFMPIATCGSVKSLDSIEMKKIGARIILGNTYHLYLRPSDKLIKKLGGLHRFMNWSGPILTDSGGYQVFSLAKMRKISEEGAEFKSHIDGSSHLLTPEKSIEIQQNLGSDIIMVLDECAPYPASKKYIKESLELTTRWAERCKIYFDKKNKALGKNKSLLFGIVQGGIYKNFREESAKQLVKIGFNGYAIGGVSVGESSKKMFQVVDWTIPFLPEDKPRYLMGVGKPEEIVDAVSRGIDMFDCVIPTRNARHGTIYKFKSKSENFSPCRNLPKGTPTSSRFYEIIHITNEKFKNDKKPIDKNCGCFTCQNYSRAYLRHLFVSGELLALRLASIHNIYFYLEMMKRIRKSV
ncbi:tRNA guanosine(34) transglycosylase Tgt [Candidatus Parcubacteria bacterium]|nr:tRNA guanosine(34) transglycosylase Tgt [Candidatus Parcubacteria bacterium]